MDTNSFLSENENLLKILIDHYKELDEHKKAISKQMNELSKILKSYLLYREIDTYEGRYCKVKIDTHKKKGKISSKTFNEKIKILNENRLLEKGIIINLDYKSVKFLLEKEDVMSKYLEFLEEPSDINKKELVNKLLEDENGTEYLKLDLDAIKSLHENKDIDENLAEKIFEGLYVKELKVDYK